MTKLVAIVSAEGEIRTQQKSSVLPKEAQALTLGLKHALQEDGGAGIHCVTVWREKVDVAEVATWKCQFEYWAH